MQPESVTILFATTNPHKIEEVAAILAPAGVTVIGLNDPDAAGEGRCGVATGQSEVIPEPVEDADTFTGNARIKAIAYAKATGRITLADDSGLEVDALDGRPGVHSARFARDEVGEERFAAMTRTQRDAANNEKLLRLLADVPPARRTARFICAMALANPSGDILAESCGKFEGVITDQPRGTNGFGYDPLLELPDLMLTSAELSPEEKNARSHRGIAARNIASALADTTGIKH